MLAHAMSSTRPVTPSSSFSGGLASARTELCPWCPGSSRSVLGPELLHRLFAQAALQRRLDVVDDPAVEHVDPGCACSIVTPGLRRANR